MDRFFIIFSFFLAVNLIASSYYAPMLWIAEEVLETNSSQEYQEKELKKEIDFYLNNFKFLSLIFQNENQIFFLSDSAGFSIYEQDILIPPPDFL